MICKHLIEANHGRINVFSDGVDKGSRFVFTMRMTQNEYENPSHEVMIEPRLGDPVDYNEKESELMRMSNEEKKLLGTIRSALSQSSSKSLRASKQASSSLEDQEEDVGNLTMCDVYHSDRLN